MGSFTVFAALVFCTFKFIDVEATGMVHVFNASSTRVSKGETLTFWCQVMKHSNGDGMDPLKVEIRKWFGNSSWIMSINEDLQGEAQLMWPARYSVATEHLDDGMELTFRIDDAEYYDTGNYTCQVQNGMNNKTVHVTVSREPYNITLMIDGEVKASMYHGDDEHHHERGKQAQVNLDTTYRVMCIVAGGIPCPNVTLKIGDMRLTRGVMRSMTMERENTLKSVPSDVTTVTYDWKPTVADIGRQFECEAGVDDPRAAWTNFVPVVRHDEPLFDCEDETVMMEGENDLHVSCRVISSSSNLTRVVVKLVDRDLTINAKLGSPDEHITTEYERDARHMVSVVWTPKSFSWNVTLTVKNAGMMTDLDSAEFLFEAENMHGPATHVVIINDQTSTNSAAVTAAVSMATVMMLSIMLMWF